MTNNLPPIQTLPTSALSNVLDFLKSQYGAAYYGADPNYFNWFFGSVPCRWFAPERDKGMLPANAMLGSDGEILAIHIYLPFDCLSPWGGKRGVFDEEWINGANIPGAGRVLATHLLASCDIYAGLGCNDLSENAFRKLGLDFSNETPRLVALLSASGLNDLLRRSGFEDQLSDPRHETTSLAPWHLLPIAACLSQDIFTHHRDVIRIGVDRSNDWLSWRYDNHPYITYHCISPDPDGRSGAAIVRLEAVAGTDLQNARIVDFLPAPDAAPQVLAAALSFARDHQCLIADFWTTAKSTADRLMAAANAAGILLLRNPRIPYMYQPCAFGKRNGVNLAIAIGGQSAGQDASLQDFHTVKADSPQDILRHPDSGAILLRKPSYQSTK